MMYFHHILYNNYVDVNYYHLLTVACNLANCKVGVVFCMCSVIIVIMGVASLKWLCHLSSHASVGVTLMNSLDSWYVAYS